MRRAELGETEKRKILKPKRCRNCGPSNWRKTESHTIFVFNKAISWFGSHSWRNAFVPLDFALVRNVDSFNFFPQNIDLRIGIANLKHQRHYNEDKRRAMTAKIFNVSRKQQKQQNDKECVRLRFKAYLSLSKVLFSSSFLLSCVLKISYSFSLFHLLFVYCVRCMCFHRWDMNQGL